MLLLSVVSSSLSPSLQTNLSVPSVSAFSLCPRGPSLPLLINKGTSWSSDESRERHHCWCSWVARQSLQESLLEGGTPLRKHDKRLWAFSSSLPEAKVSNHLTEKRETTGFICSPTKFCWKKHDQGRTRAAIQKTLRNFCLLGVLMIARELTMLSRPHGGFVLLTSVCTALSAGGKLACRASKSRGR